LVIRRLIRLMIDLGNIAEVVFNMSEELVAQIPNRSCSNKADAVRFEKAKSTLEPCERENDNRT